MAEMLAGTSPLTFKPSQCEVETETFVNASNHHKVKVPVFYDADESAFKSIQQSIVAVGRLHSAPHPFLIQTLLWEHAKTLCKGKRRSAWATLLENIAQGARTTDRLLDAVGQHIANSSGNAYPCEATLAMFENLKFGIGGANMPHGDYADRWQTQGHRPPR